MTSPEVTDETVRPRPRGRPPAFDRTVALDSLLALFWRQGYDGATQESMLAATGLSSSSLYRAFGTKSEIFVAALQRYLDLSDDVLGPLETGKGGRADLERFLDRVKGQIGGAGSPGGCLVVTTLSDPVNLDPRISELTQRHMRRMEAAIRGAVVGARGEGGASGLSTRDLGSAIFAGVLGVLACSAADVDKAVTMLGGVRALVRSMP